MSVGFLKKSSLFGLLSFGRRRSHAKDRAAIDGGQGIVVQSQPDYRDVQQLDLYRVGNADLEGQRFAYCFLGSIKGVLHHSEHRAINFIDIAFE